MKSKRAKTHPVGYGKDDRRTGGGSGVGEFRCGAR